MEESMTEECIIQLDKSVSRNPTSEGIVSLPDIDLRVTRSRASQKDLSIQFVMGKRQVQKLLELKQQLEVIRERKATVPKVPDPQVVARFKAMREIKNKLMVRQKLRQRVEEKKKELSKLKHLYGKSELQFQEKSQVFKEKSALLRVLGSKMETELNKTKDRYRQVEFNRVVVLGVKKVLYYRLAQILFNQNTKTLFNAIASTNPQDQKDDDSLGNCLGYLTLFICLVGTICGGRIWINFMFKGPRSTIRLPDGSTAVLHPKDIRFSDSIKCLSQQLYQLMHDSMKLKVTNNHNFYQLCEELSKEILTIR